MDPIFVTSAFLHFKIFQTSFEPGLFIQKSSVFVDMVIASRLVLAKIIVQKCQTIDSNIIIYFFSSSYYPNGQPCPGFAQFQILPGHRGR